MDNRRDVIESARKFDLETRCLAKGHIMSTIAHQDAKYREAMADFAIKHAADDRAAFIATLRERVEATIVPLKDAMFRKDYVDKADVLAILDEMEAV